MEGVTISQLERYISEISFILSDSKKLEELVNKVLTKHDENKNGTLEEKEFENYLVVVSEQIGLPEPEIDLVGDLFVKFDANNDGVLEPMEITILTQEMLKITQNEMLKEKEKRLT